MITTKRIYETPSKDDGFRVLVDRLWPRGMSKDDAKLDLWLKEIAPSHELRKWFNHDINKRENFQEKYKEELKEHPDARKKIITVCKQSEKVTLLYGSKDTEHNNAIALHSSIIDNL